MSESKSVQKMTFNVLESYKVKPDMYYAVDVHSERMGSDWEMWFGLLRLPGGVSFSFSGFPFTESG